MAVQSDGSNAAYPANGTSTTFAITTANNDRLMLAMGYGAYWSISVSSVAYAGAGMTQYDSAQMQLFHLVNPASGSNNLVFTYSGYGKIFSHGASWSGVDQTTPVGTVVNNNGTGNVPTTGSVTCPTDGAVYGTMHTGYSTSTGGVPTINTGTLLQGRRDGASGKTSASGYRASTGAVAWNVNTSPAWYATGTPINAVAAASGRPNANVVTVLDAVNRAANY